MPAAHRVTRDMAAVGRSLIDVFRVNQVERPK